MTFGNTYVPQYSANVKMPAFIVGQTGRNQLNCDPGEAVIMPLVHVNWVNALYPASLSPG